MFPVVSPNCYRAIVICSCSSTFSIIVAIMVVIICGSLPSLLPRERESKHSLRPSLPFPSASPCLPGCLAAWLLQSLSCCCCTYLAPFLSDQSLRLNGRERQVLLWIASLDLSLSLLQHSGQLCTPHTPVCHFTRIPIISRIPVRLIIY